MLIRLLTSRPILVASVLMLSCLGSGCEGAKVEVGYQPSGIPLEVSIDSNGEISFSISQEFEYPTPLGVFTVGLVIDPAAYFQVDNSLTVRFNGEDHIYDLHGGDFSIDFQPGYYRQLRLSKTGANIMLELERAGSSSEQSSSGQSPRPTEAAPEQTEQDCSQAYGGRLRVGDTATVVVYQVTIRDRPGGPGVGSKIDVLARDRSVEVLEGPLCAHGLYYVRVRSEVGSEGWVAEGDTENYYLEP